MDLRPWCDNSLWILVQAHGSVMSKVQEELIHDQNHMQSECIFVSMVGARATGESQVCPPSTGNAGTVKAHEAAHSMPWL